MSFATPPWQPAGSGVALGEGDVEVFGDGVVCALVLVFEEPQAATPMATAVTRPLMRSPERIPDLFMARSVAAFPDPGSRKPCSGGVDFRTANPKRGSGG